MNPVDGRSLARQEDGVLQRRETKVLGRQLRERGLLLLLSCPSLPCGKHWSGANLGAL